MSSGADPNQTEQDIESLLAEEDVMLYHPFRAPNVISNPLIGEADSQETKVLFIKPNPLLNSLTYSVSNRNVPLMRKQAKKSRRLLVKKKREPN